MHSLKEYLERRQDEELKGMLLAYCEGCGDFDAETALAICEILFQRLPGKPEPRAEFVHLCLRYTV